MFPIISRRCFSEKVEGDGLQAGGTLRPLGTGEGAGPRVRTAPVLCVASHCKAPGQRLTDII